MDKTTGKRGSMTKGVTGLRWALLICVTLSAPSLPTRAFQSKSKRAINLPRKTLAIQVPFGISESLWRQRIPRDNPMSPGKIALGQALYFDKRLSVNGTVSCATCHDPARAFTDSNLVAKGVGDTAGSRNAPTVLNAMFNDSLFWDGRAPSLEEQVKHPLMNSVEMGMGSSQVVIARISAIPGYRLQFKRVFKSEKVSMDAIAKAIAAYERTLLSGNSPFDRYISGDSSAITDAQLRGWELFKGKAKCLQCHAYSLSTPFFTDFKFYNTGVAVTDSLFDKLTQKTQPSDPASFRKTTETMLAHSAGFSELGRFNVTLEQADMGAFKTPTLRDIELTSPYMHDGSLKTLIDVVHFYNHGGKPNSHLDERIHQLQLTDAEVNDVVQFLRALTSDDVLRQCQTANPQTRTAVPIK